MKVEPGFNLWNKADDMGGVLDKESNAALAGKAVGHSTSPASKGKAPRTPRGEKTLRKILDAALAEFGQHGFHDSSIVGITTRAKVALGTFYTYFESKEELFRALVLDMSHATRQHVAEAVAGAPDRLAAERIGLAAFISFTRQHPELYRIIEEAQFVAEDVYREHYKSFAEGYRQGLAAAAKRGEISAGPDELRAWALIGMSVFLGMRYGIWNEDVSPEQVADGAIDLVSDGLRTRSP